MRIKNLFLLVFLGVLSATAATTPKYVFFFIGDGMGMGHVNATDYYNRMVLGNDEKILMLQFPVASQAQTYSASSPITDSAAAGTALSTGNKTKNGMLGMTPDSVPVTSIARTLKDNGWGVAVLTSVSPDDATPGAFYAHQPYRSMYYEIGCDAVNSGYDFLGGAELRGAVDRKTGKPTDLMDRVKKAGIKVVRGTDALRGVDADRVIVLAPEEARTNNNDIGYTIDSIPGAMTIQQLTGAALDHLLKKSPDRFFMMVEGGNIDHAAHANDPGGTIKEILNFQNAIQVAYDFYKKHPEETLIVVTADHDTGGMAIGTRTNRTGVNLSLIDYQRMSKDAFSDYCQKLLKDNTAISWEEMKQLLSDKFGFWSRIKLTEKQTKKLHKLFNKTFVERKGKDSKELYNSFNEFAVNVFDTLNAWVGTGFTTSSHTANPVPVFAIGAGAEKFSRALNNTEIPMLILESTGVKAR